jgi:hypothetical protein
VPQPLSGGFEDEEGGRTKGGRAEKSPTTALNVYEHPKASDQA